MAGSIAGPGLSSLIELSTKGLGAFHQVGAGFDELRKKALSANQVSSIAQKSWGGLGTIWQHVTKIGGSLWGALEKIALTGAVVGTVAAGGMFALARGAISASTEAENASAQLSTLYHSTEKAASIIAWLQDYAAKTPFEFTGLREATVALEVYGLSATKWIPIVADLAAGSTGDIVQAARAVAKATTGESEMLKELGVTARDLWAAGAAGGAGQGLLSQTAEQAEALKKAMETVISQRFGGAVARFGSTLKALTSNISDFWSKFLRTIGGAGLFDKAKQSATVVLSFFDWLSAGGASASQAAENMKRAGEKVSDAVDQLLGRGKYAKTAVPGQQDVPSRLDRIAGALSKIFSIPLKAFGLEVGNLTKGGGVIDRLIGGLERAADYLDKNWGTMWKGAKKAVGEAWTWIVAKIDAGVKWLTGGVKKGIGDALAGIMVGLDQVVQRASQSVDLELDRIAIRMMLFAAKLARPAGIIMQLAGAIALLAGDKVRGGGLLAAGAYAEYKGRRLEWEANVEAQSLLAKQLGVQLRPAPEMGRLVGAGGIAGGAAEGMFGREVNRRRRELEAEMNERRLPFAWEARPYLTRPSAEETEKLLQTSQQLPYTDQQLRMMGAALGEAAGPAIARAGQQAESAGK